MKKALLIIDMINKLDFPGGDKLLKQSLPVASNILKLKNKLKKHKVPVIYVNDNFGLWKASWQEVLEACESKECLGTELSQILKPEEDDYFVLKPKHSGFYSSNLEILLSDLKVGELILTGIAGNICVLFTANDAHMRGYKIHVPKNCIASNTKRDNDYALRQLSEVFGIRIAAL
ncbi:MAG TPA: isochorismatase family cysteine hydrolase [Bacteriovoracaceae bacterium]|nr:isochorismatase family cysteine hydrolase [Bacteriovoracaceae bacterium]